MIESFLPRSRLSVEAIRSSAHVLSPDGGPRGGSVTCQSFWALQQAMTERDVVGVGRADFYGTAQRVVVMPSGGDPRTAAPIRGLLVFETLKAGMLKESKPPVDVVGFGHVEGREEEWEEDDVQMVPAARELVRLEIDAPLGGVRVDPGSSGELREKKKKKNGGRPRCWFACEHVADPVNQTLLRAILHHAVGAAAEDFEPMEDVVRSGAWKSELAPRVGHWLAACGVEPVGEGGATEHRKRKASALPNVEEALLEIREKKWEEEDGIGLQRYTRDMLKLFCERENLPTSGTKAALATRIIQHLS